MTPVQCKYDRGYREYQYGGTWFPSITSIIGAMAPKERLEAWKQRYSHAQLDAIREYVSVRGNLVHYNVLQWYCNRHPRCVQDPPELKWLEYAVYHPGIQEEIRISMVFFEEFRSQYTLKPKSIEKVVYDKEYGFAGRVDFQGYLKREDEWVPVLVDIKTGKETYIDEVSMQLAAYNHGLGNFGKELYTLRFHVPGNIGGVNIGADVPHWEFVQVPDAWEDFRHCLDEFKRIEHYD